MVALKEKVELEAFDAEHDHKVNWRCGIYIHNGILLSYKK